MSVIDTMSFTGDLRNMPYYRNGHQCRLQNLITTGFEYSCDTSRGDGIPITTGLEQAVNTY